MAARAEIMTWPPGAHASTFGGNPVCLAAALETVRLLQEKYIANAAKVGEFMMTKLKSKIAGQPGITDIRGRGLMIGVEVTKNRDAVIEECFRRGLLLLGAGPNAIRISPPLIVDEDQATFAVDVLSEAISAV
jgi:4-aminobutyrate aminotransferase